MQPSRAVGRPRREVDVPKAIRLYDMGISLASISKLIDVPYTVLRQRLLEQGVQLRPRGRQRHSE